MTWVDLVGSSRAIGFAIRQPANAQNGHFGIMLESMSAVVSPSNVRELKTDDADDAIANLDTNSFASLIRSCKDLPKGKQIHAQIRGSDHHRNLYLANLLVEMYGKCGSLGDARSTFDNMDQPNHFSWNIVFQAYANNGQLQEARSIFEMMPQKDVVSWNAIVAAYAQKGYLQEARRMFDTMPHRNVVSWTTMTAAYANAGDVDAARDLFDRMPSRNVVSWTTMISAYAEAGDLQLAKRMFEKMPQRNIVSWTAMAAAYAQNGHLCEARSMLDMMPEWNVVSWTVLLIAYVETGLVEEASSMFDQMPERNAIAWTAMVSAYAVNGDVQEAKTMFDTMPHRNLVSWTAMIVAYGRNGQSKEAILLFKLMDLEGIEADEVSFIAVVDVCADLNALAEGKLIHFDCVQRGFQSDLVLGNALVNMYGRCGCVGDARSIFDELPQRNVASWNAMVAAYTLNGHGKHALDLFLQMKLRGDLPDHITFVSVLSACSHAGLTHDGCCYFLSISSDFGVDVTANHYRCMVDLLGRAGRLNHVKGLIESMPFEPGPVAWTTYLGACRMLGDAKQGADAAEQALGLEPQCSSSYILLSNVCSSNNHAWLNQPYWEV